jgi:hypothetical protein
MTTCTCGPIYGAKCFQKEIAVAVVCCRAEVCGFSRQAYEGTAKINREAYRSLKICVPGITPSFYPSPDKERRNLAAL